MRRRNLATTLVLVALAAAYGLRRVGTAPQRPHLQPSAATAAPLTTPARPGLVLSLAEAARSHAESAWVEGRGTVARKLPTDTKGTRHQRFLLRLADGTTVLVAHNLELAPSVPLAVGDPVEVRGEYKWNDKGGILHWTHHDPKARHAGGWIRLAGKEYS